MVEDDWTEGSLQAYDLVTDLEKDHVRIDIRKNYYGRNGNFSRVSIGETESL